MDTVKKIQDWYISMCNGDWEHSYGVNVETLDNPGWHVKIDLVDTDMENIHFTSVEYGIGKNSEPDSDDWLTCKVENKVFHGYGGSKKLEEIFKCFLAWNEKNR